MSVLRVFTDASSRRSALFMGACGIAFLLGTSAAAAAPEVWHWGACTGPSTVRVTITQDGERIAETRVPLCKAPSGRLPETAAARRFDFAAPALAERLGTASSRDLGGSLWMAGAETYGIIMGISFQTKGRVWLNTLHVVPASGASRAEIAPGVLVETESMAR